MEFTGTTRSYERIPAPLRPSRYVRHPAYLGFYVWALGTQVILGNPFCLVAYVGVLYRFFSERIRAEEALLVDFFPTEYPRYQKETWSGIPGL